VRKGELTRQAILEQAATLASQVGLEGLTIGSLAEALELSKSGLFAHFRSKEALQIQLLDFAVERFVDAVVRPALGAARGEPRLRALFEGWVDWARTGTARSGCVFVAASTELDDQPGPVRDRLVRLQKDWLEFITQAYRVAVSEGHLAGGDPEQFAHDLYGIMLGWHHAARLLRDPRAESRARAAFEALLSAARAPRAGRRGSGRPGRRPRKEGTRG
ncbi:MAG TPA: TetR/AcrR family transcriptional regulator, partial [Vicinamibacteria bacterium]|nr:TetR/AcrR family transcriptional regulator [Vicinamibacteria bacterium]